MMLNTQFEGRPKKHRDWQRVHEHGTHPVGRGRRHLLRGPRDLRSVRPPGRYPCQGGRTPKLVDPGGVYENTALEPIDDLPGDRACIVALNAGGVFRTGPFGGLPIIKDLMRSEGLLYRQSTALRMRAMVERFKAWEDATKKGTTPPAGARRGVLFGLATTVEDPPAESSEGRPERPELARELTLVKTSLGKFPLERRRDLVYRGWWLTGATLTKFHRDLLPQTLPAWTDSSP
jgi:NTE family protein